MLTTENISIRVLLCNLAGFDLGLEELEDVYSSLIIETAFGVVEFGEGS